MILIPAAFSIAYGQEITKGTVRTLTCYPVGVFEITIAKLAYAAVVSFIFGLPVFLLPTRSRTRETSWRPFCDFPSSIFRDTFDSISRSLCRKLYNFCNEEDVYSTYSFCKSFGDVFFSHYFNDS